MTGATHLNLSEVFGPTIQGEGRHAGQLASFVRLAGCNLSCSWCDSAYTWDWDRYDHSEESHPTTIVDAIDQIGLLPGRIVITGGEPLLQSPALAVLMEGLAGREFDLETNGTRPLGPTAGRWATITCSPKIIPSAATPGADRLDRALLADPVTDIKFVVRDDDDLRAARATVERYSLPPGRVWLMPEGTDHATLTGRTPWLAEAAARFGFNFTSRLHVYAWGDERGH